MRTAARSRGERPYNNYRGYIETDVKFKGGRDGNIANVSHM